MNRPFADEKKENAQRLLNEILHKQVVLTALPPRCTFEHSWRCNYNCKKCTYSSLARGHDFSARQFPEWAWEDIERMAAELFPTMQYTESTLLGEPFLSPSFPRLMDLFRKFGVYYRPTTNGSLLADRNLEHIFGVVDWLKCSFDAHTEDLYPKLYLNDCFRTVVKNLKRFSIDRSSMQPYPWFRVGLVLMRTNLPYLKEYADFVFQELGVDDMEIMGLNYANEAMTGEFYWDIPEQVNRALRELVEHCIQNQYRLRLPFACMPRPDGTWIDGLSSADLSSQWAATQPKADNRPQHPYSEEVVDGDIFGNREQMEAGYVWSNDMRVNSVTAEDGSRIGVCEFFTRPFFKPPTQEQGEDWIKYESCGSCSTFVFGNLKKDSFAAIYNNEMMRKVRAFFYEKYRLPRQQWMFPCRHCLCVDQIYCYESNGRPNVGLRFFPGEDLFHAPNAPILPPERLEGRKVILFGTGSAGRRIARNFPLEIAYFVDNSPKTWGGRCMEKPVENPEKLRLENPGGVAIIVASQYYAEISKQLQGMGFEEEINYWNGLRYFAS
jgi:MoaA/NifB/PqqE/SkfB family radical SAM enzyme